MVLFMVNAQGWLDQNYPKEQRSFVFHLPIQQRNLEGLLDLSDFVNLEDLNCSFNQITTLNLTGLTKLEFIACSENFLTSLDFISTLNPEKLTVLHVNDNDILNQDLSSFSRFVNLEQLLIGNYNKERLILGMHFNRFDGSLISLKDLTKLKKLDISHTNINKGVEYLSNSLMSISCHSVFGAEIKVGEIKEELRSFLNNVLLGKIKDLLVFLSNLTTYQDQGVVTKDVYEKINELETIKRGFEFDGLKLLQEEFVLECLQTLIPNQRLRNDYLRYDLCQNCYQPNILLGLCRDCSVKKLRNLIPYEEFIGKKYLAKGGFGTVYKVKLKRLSEENVVLKVLHNSQGIDKEEFLREVANYQMFEGGIITRCFGITQDAIGNYGMVMMYCPDGSLRDYLQQHPEKTIRDKLEYLSIIAIGLNSIHEKNLFHKDFHPGNVLVFKNTCIITDLGLSSATHEQKGNEFKGMLPYIAPEVLRGEKYTSAADVYSFGMMMYEVLTGLEPFHNEEISEDELRKEIIENNLRPPFSDGFLFPKSLKYLEDNFEGFKVLQFLEELIRKCWEVNPNKRPTTNQKKIKSSNDLNNFLLSNLRSQVDQTEEKEVDKFNELLRSVSKIYQSSKFLRSESIYYTAREEIKTED